MKFNFYHLFHIYSIFIPSKINIYNKYYSIIPNIERNIREGCTGRQKAKKHLFSICIHSEWNNWNNGLNLPEHIENDGINLGKNHGLNLFPVEIEVQLCPACSQRGCGISEICDRCPRRESCPYSKPSQNSLNFDKYRNSTYSINPNEVFE